MKCYNCKSGHRLHVKQRISRPSDPEAREVCVVRGGDVRRPYLWLEGRNEVAVTLSGNALLRKVALAILAELKEARR